jgi:O-antigen/teichoic acid export membrane protein
MWLGIDRAIFFVLLGRIWGIGAGLVTIIFVTRFLSPDLQGYYYTFYSLIALQIFAEMGLNFAIIQLASHEMAALNWTHDRRLAGLQQSKRRLQSLVYFAFAWFSAAGIVMIAALLPAGIWFFGAVIREQSIAKMVIPAWSVLVVLTAINLFVLACVAIIEGCGKVAEVAVLRLTQSVCSVFSVWLALSLGWGVFALAINSFVVAVVGVIWLSMRYQGVLRDFISERIPLPGIDWRVEIWPFQWRIAVSSMSGFLISQLFNPLILATHGAAEAGRMGMSMQVIAAMNGGAMAWITTKAPTFGRLIAMGNRLELDKLFFRSLVQSLAILLGGVCAISAIFWYLNFIGSPYGLRVLPPKLFYVLFLVCLTQHVVLAEAAYLRAHKQEPFLIVSIVSGLVTAALASQLIPRFGTTGAVISYATVALLIGFCGGTAVFISKRRSWRSLG